MVGMLGWWKILTTVFDLLVDLSRSSSSTHAQPPLYLSWSSQSVWNPVPGLVSTLFHHMYSTAASNRRSAHSYETLFVALRNQPSSGATRTLPPFGAILKWLLGGLGVSGNECSGRNQAADRRAESVDHLWVKMSPERDVWRVPLSRRGERLRRSGCGPAVPA